LSWIVLSNPLRLVFVHLVHGGSARSGRNIRVLSTEDVVWAKWAWSFLILPIERSRDFLNFELANDFVAARYYSWPSHLLPCSQPSYGKTV